MPQTIVNQAGRRLSEDAGRSAAQTIEQPVFSKIEAVSLKDRVIVALKDAFFSGKLKPGDAIIERQLAREMKVGTPVVREALISLEGQGYVYRVTNTGTYVTEFTTEEAIQLYTLRVELEVLALQWARPRVTEADLNEMEAVLGGLVEAGQSGNRREFLERDLAFHRRYWALSGNAYLAETLERLMAPLFAFGIMAVHVPTTAEMAREHYEVLNALRNLQEPQFSSVTRKILTGFSSRWITSISERAKELGL